MRIDEELMEIWLNEVYDINNSLSSWAIHRSDLRCLLYYTGVCSGTPLSVPLQSRSNGLGVKDVVELCASDVSRSSL